MQFETFSRYITDQISVYSTVDYGEVGTKYLVVLGIKDDKIVPFGELIYRCFRDGLSDSKQLIEFGKECELYQLGLRSEMPTLCYRESGKLEIK